MKKLNLGSLGIRDAEVLTRAQLKNIFGGSAPIDDGENGSCDQKACEAKSTSSKSCTCSARYDKCMCTTGS